MSPRTRFTLLCIWSDWFALHTESWQGPIGTELAHLFAAIAADRFVWLPTTSPVVQVLRSHDVPQRDAIWAFIRIPTEHAN